MAADPDVLERAILALRAQIDEAQARLRQREREVAELDDRRHEAEGRLALARREVESFEGRLAQREAELEQARNEALALALDDALAARDEAAEALAVRILAVLEGFAGLEERLRAVVELHSELSARGVRLDLPEEPPALMEAWQRLQEVVRASLREHEPDLGRPLETLPAELHESARQHARELPDRTSSES